VARAGVSVEGLVRAAAELADEIGFEQVTVSALARGFDVTVASLYSHIKNADDLRTRVAALALTELADRASDALAGRAGKDALTAFAAAYRDYAKQHPGRYEAARLRIAPDSVAAEPALRHARSPAPSCATTSSPTRSRSTPSACSAARCTASQASKRQACSRTPATWRRPGIALWTPSTSP
jgi:AcrR family transcriptional regulator